MKLIICVEHVGISAAKELNELTPHIFLLVDVLYLHTTFRHEMLDQSISIILANPTELTQHLIGKEIDPFFVFPKLFGLFGQHERKRKVPV